MEVDMKEFLFGILALLLLSLPLIGDERGKEPNKPIGFRVVETKSEVREALPGINKVPEADRERVMFWIRLQSLNAGIGNEEIWLKQNNGDVVEIWKAIPEDWEPNREELMKAEEAFKLSTMSKDSKTKVEKVAPTEETPPPIEDTPSEAMDDETPSEAVDEEPLE
jgi:hypothetical protein